MKHLIFFSAKWCNACQSLKPTVDAVTRATGVTVANIDVDYDATLVEHYNIKNIPALILLENGQERSRLIGTQTESKLKEFING